MPSALTRLACREASSIDASLWRIKVTNGRIAWWTGSSQSAPKLRVEVEYPAGRLTLRVRGG